MICGLRRAEVTLGPFSIRVEDGAGKGSPQLVADTVSGALRPLPLSDSSLFSLERDLVFSFDFGAAADANVDTIAFETQFTDGFKRVAAKSAE